MMVKRICIDFDGVIHSYTSGWKGADVIPDPPVDGAIDFIRSLQTFGYEVIVFTTRGETIEGCIAVHRWLSDNGLTGEIRITDRKIGAEVYIDDRALRFEGRWPTHEQLIEAARPWNKPDRKPAG